MTIDNALPGDWDAVMQKHIQSKAFSDDCRGPDYQRFELRPTKTAKSYPSDYRSADVVNKPPHYTDTGIECIDYIHQRLTPGEFSGFLQGNVTKYLHRYKTKNGVEDLRKASWYLQRLIQHRVEEGL